MSWTIDTNNLDGDEAEEQAGRTGSAAESLSLACYLCQQLKDRAHNLCDAQCFLQNALDQTKANFEVPKGGGYFDQHTAYNQGKMPENCHQLPKGGVACRDVALSLVRVHGSGRPMSRRDWEGQEDYFFQRRI